LVFILGISVSYGQGRAGKRARVLRPGMPYRPGRANKGGRIAGWGRGGKASVKKRFFLKKEAKTLALWRPR